jgi:hypothetical protein
MAGSEIIAKLQGEMDSLEYRPDAWGARLDEAEEWLALEDLPPGWRGACVLACKAKVALRYCWKKPRLSRCAFELGLSPSAFSHFLTRWRSKLSLVRELEEALRPPKNHG